MKISLIRLMTGIPFMQPSSSKITFEDSLGAKVVEPGKCQGCGTCIVVCPFNCLEYSKEEPILIKKCKACGICARVCPKYHWSLPELELFAFGRERNTDEEFGVHRRLAVAQATEDKMRKASQDGGVVTALLLNALSNEIIDGAVVSGISTEKPFLTVPKVASTVEEILESAGTRYSYSPSIFALATAVKQKKEKLAFVGTPCQIRAVREMQIAGLKKYTDPVKLLIGLMCSESFTYEGLMERLIHEMLHIDPHAITKMNIKGKMIITTETGIQTAPLADVKQYARKCCHFCDDFSSELADISAGGLGLEGWTFSIIRTEMGEELFSKAQNQGFIRTRDAKEEPNALNLLQKLSKKKRQNAVS